MSLNLKSLLSRLVGLSTLVILGGISVFSAFAIIPPPPALGNRPNLPIMYQGRITDSSFLPITDASRPMIFSIYDDPTAGTCLWATGPDIGVNNCGAEDAVSVNIDGGLFTVPLGNLDTNNPEIRTNFNTGTFYLQISVWNGASYETLSPRKQLGGAVYAYDASYVEGHTFTGINGGQTLNGGLNASENLTLSSTFDVTKGQIIFDGDALTINTVAYIWPGTQGAASTVLTNDGSGNLTWAAGGGGGVGTDGNENTWAGTGALASNTLGISNTAYGYNSLGLSTNGDRNTALGVGALGNSDGASDNTATGYNALIQNTNGINNTANGSQALFSNTTGAFNTAIGSGALRSNDIGASNVAVGYNALLFNVSGNDNIALGAGALAGVGVTGNGNIAIGTASNSNAGGGNSNVSIGYNALFQNNDNQNTAVGYQALYTNSSGFNNVAIGENALYLNQMGNNTAVGGEAMYTNSTGQNNVALGYGAMLQNDTGSFNTVLGSSAWIFGATGDENTIVGYGAFYHNDSGGSRNTAMGKDSLQGNTSGSDNTALGLASLHVNTTGNFNTAIGESAMAQNGTGANNTALGVAALNQSNGDNNIAIGYYAGVTSTIANANLTGSDNIFIGYNSGPGTPTQLTNAVAIGTNATVTSDNALILGSISGINGATDSARIGIGTASPDANAALDIVSTTKAFMPPRMTTIQRDAIPSPTAGMMIYNTTTNKLNVYTTAWETVTSS